MMNKYIKKAKGLQMSDNKLENEINGNDVNFEVNNGDTANNNIDENLDASADMPMESVTDTLLSPAADGEAEGLEISSKKSNEEVIPTLDEITESNEEEAFAEDTVTIIEENATSVEDEVTETEEGATPIENEVAEVDEDVLSIENEVAEAEEDAISIENDVTEAEEDVISIEDEAAEDEMDSDEGKKDDVNFDEYAEEDDIHEDFESDTENDEEFEIEFYEEEDSNKKRREKPVGSRFIDSLFDFIELFIFSLAAVFIITTFFLRHSVVDGTSMERTLYDGEHIIISDLFYKPKRGDIIVCEDYSTDLPIPIVKRVIALAGDRVEIDTYGNVKINGELLDETDYVYIDPNSSFTYDPYDQVVPEGEIFVMGDHRNVSSDSRAIGTIKEDSILGKVLFRFYPFDKFGAVE